MKRNTLLYCLSLLIILASSCKGPEGDPGPAGAQGPAGPQGPAGQNGIGASSLVFTVTPEAWQMPLEGFPNWVYTRDISQITQQIYNSGTVVAFGRLTATGPWVALPYTFAMSTFTEEGEEIMGTHEYSFGYEVGKFHLDISGNGMNEEDLPAGIAEGMDFKVVIIPATPAGRLAAIDYKNHDEVCKAFNLPLN